MNIVWAVCEYVDLYHYYYVLSLSVFVAFLVALQLDI